MHRRVEWAAGAGHQSGGWFDHGPGVLLLKDGRAQVAEGRMQPPAVVDMVEEAGRVGSDVLEGLVSHRVDRFDLQRLMKLSAFALTLL